MSDDEHEPDPGLMALYLLFSVLAVAWIGPYAWQMLVTGDPFAFRGMSEAWQTGLFEFLGRVAGGYANPNEAGAAAYAFNWIYTLVLFIAVVGLVAFPTMFRGRVNELFDGESQ